MMLQPFNEVLIVCMLAVFVLLLEHAHELNDRGQRICGGERVNSRRVPIVTES